VTNYRIYVLNPKGRILTGADVDCATDNAALAWAKTTLGDDGRAEIWQAARSDVDVRGLGHSRRRFALGRCAASFGRASRRGFDLTRFL